MSSLTARRIALGFAVSAAILCVLQWLAFLHSRTLGEVSMFAAPIAMIAFAAFIGRHHEPPKAFLAALLGVAACYVVFLMNYAYLYWLRVLHLGELDASLFGYFGAVYGAVMHITAIICGGVSFLLAARRRAADESDKSSTAYP